jgi:hypothetical protein
MRDEREFLFFYEILDQNLRFYVNFNFNFS